MYSNQPNKLYIIITVYLVPEFCSSSFLFFLLIDCGKSLFYSLSLSLSPFFSSTPMLSVLFLLSLVASKSEQNVLRFPVMRIPLSVESDVLRCGVHFELLLENDDGAFFYFSFLFSCNFYFIFLIPFWVNLFLIL